jgi:CubicO group peptidase (beta-lactamase class C family)
MYGQSGKDIGMCIVGNGNVAEELPVTTNTLFAIGSSTKAFTTMGPGILVDEGKFDLDKPVREY